MTSNKLEDYKKMVKWWEPAKVKYDARDEKRKRRLEIDVQMSVDSSMQLIEDTLIEQIKPIEIDVQSAYDHLNNKRKFFGLNSIHKRKRKLSKSLIHLKDFEPLEVDIDKKDIPPTYQRLTNEQIRNILPRYTVSEMKKGTPNAGEICICEKDNRTYVCQEPGKWIELDDFVNQAYVRMQKLARINTNAYYHRKFIEIDNMDNIWIMRKDQWENMGQLNQEKIFELLNNKEDT